MVYMKHLKVYNFDVQAAEDWAQGVNGEFTFCLDLCYSYFESTYCNR